MNEEGLQKLRDAANSAGVELNVPTSTASGYIEADPVGSPA